MLKVDVEGQERQVLAGARDFFDACWIRVVYRDGYDDKGLTRLAPGSRLLPEGWPHP